MFFININKIFFLKRDNNKKCSLRLLSLDKLLKKIMAPRILILQIEVQI